MTTKTISIPGLLEPIKLPYQLAADTKNELLQILLNLRNKGPSLHPKAFLVTPHEYLAIKEHFGAPIISGIPLLATPTPPPSRIIMDPKLLLSYEFTGSIT